MESRPETTAMADGGQSVVPAPMYPARTRSSAPSPLTSAAPASFVESPTTMGGSTVSAPAATRMWVTRVDWSFVAAMISNEPAPSWTSHGVPPSNDADRSAAASASMAQVESRRRRSTWTSPNVASSRASVSRSGVPPGRSTKAASTNARSRTVETVASAARTGPPGPATSPAPRSSAASTGPRHGRVGLAVTGDGRRDTPAIVRPTRPAATGGSLRLDAPRRPLRRPTTRAGRIGLVVALLAILALVAVGCGARRPDPAIADAGGFRRDRGGAGPGRDQGRASGVGRRGLPGSSPRADGDLVRGVWSGPGDAGQDLHVSVRRSGDVRTPAHDRQFLRAHAT